MSRIFWDTNIFIYLFEDYGELSVRTTALRERMLVRGDQLFTSTLTLGELLVKPREKRDDELRERYERALAATVALIPFDAAAARAYALVRLDRSVKAPDAIQLACAAQAGSIAAFMPADLCLRNGIRRGEIRLEVEQWRVVEAIKPDGG